MAVDYLNFGDAVRLDKLQDISKIQPDMMDCSRYEAEFDLSEEESKSNLCPVMDYISDPAEVTINRLNCGMRISPSWKFDISGDVRSGKTTAQIDVFATPARKVQKFYPQKKMPFMMGGPSIAVRPEGIIGSVYVVK